MELIGQLVEAVGRVDAQHHSPLLSLQAYDRFIRASCRDRRSPPTTEVGVVSQDAGPDDAGALEVLVVDFLLRCNQQGLGAHASLQAVVLEANAPGNGSRVRDDVLAAFPALRACITRQRRVLSDAASSGLAAAESLWTEAVEAVVDPFRVAVELATHVLGSAWTEAGLIGENAEGDGLGGTPCSALHLVTAEVIETTVAPLGVRADVVLALLQLSLQNWAAVELCWRRGSRALALQAASHACGDAVVDVMRVRRQRRVDDGRASSVDAADGEPLAVEDALSEYPLGQCVAVAQTLNDCTVRSAVLCDFEPVQAKMRAELIPLLGEMRAAAEEENGEERRMLRLLSGLALGTYGVAESYASSDAAVLSLQEALDHIQQWNQCADATSSDGSDDADRHVQAVVERVYNELTAYIDAVRSKRSMAAAAAAATAAPSASASSGHGAQGNTGRSQRGGATAQKPRGRKGGRSLAHASPRALPPPPPIGAALRGFMRHGGVPVYVATQIAAESIRACVLSRSGRRCADALASTLPASLLPSHGATVALLVCARAPLQLAAELDHCVNDAHPPTAANRSVWSSAATVAPLLESPLPPALCALAKREARGGGLRASLPPGAAGGHVAGPGMPPFQPKPMSKKALAEAQSEVATAVRVLGQRLGALLKVERAFEAQWSATEMVKQALVRHYVPRACRAWCEARRLAEQAALVRRDHSARVITRFVRYLATEKPHLHGAVRQRQQARAQQDAAATVLQKYARRWLAKEAKARLLREKQSFLRDLTVVQSLYRGRQARARCAAMRAVRAADGQAEAALLSAHFAATTIQRAYRGHATRLALLRAAGYEYVAMRLHYRDSRHYCATVIQKRVRGMLVRRTYGPAVRARCLYGRNVYRAAELERSCLCIQRWYRAHRARRAAARAQLQAEAAKRWEDGKAARTWPVPVAVGLVAAPSPPSLSTAHRETDAEVHAANVCRGFLLAKQLERRKAERTTALEARRGETYAAFDINERVF